jgi:hypothetical protein
LDGVRRLGSTLILATVLAVPSAASAAPPKGCHPKGSTTVVANARTRVFRWHRLVYGCLRKLGHPYALTSNDGYGFDRLRFVKPVLAGRYVAWAIYWESSVEGYGYGVRSMDLRTGGLSLTEFDATLSGEPEKAVVSRLVLTPGGSYAWTWTIDYKDHQAKELRKVEPNRKPAPKYPELGKLVDSGDDLDLMSLTRAGSTISWMRGGVAQSQTLT